jgi:hypothetical protein
MAVTLVVVNNFDVSRIAVEPAKTDPVLVIDPDTVLPESITLQHLESVARRCP